MGLLAENKRSTKISRDPNNTKWTKNTNSFGQRIMRSQGWEPGQYLGATDAAQSDSYTAANASYIRVALKDDMKGLGFKKAKEDEVTGLDVFSDLLSRLNGKTDDDIQEVQQARQAVKSNAYVAQRWGLMRFVPGGLLVGDEMKVEKKDEDESNDVEMTSADDAKSEQKKSKKRKASSSEEEEEASEDEASKKKRRKAEKKAKKTAAVSDGTDSPDLIEDDKAQSKPSKKSKRSKADSEDAESSASEQETKVDKKERKRLKKEKKEAKRAAKEAKKNGSASASAPASGVSTPTGTGTSTPSGSRNFVRSRFIAQKKQAVLDAKALNAIFMVKT